MSNAVFIVEQIQQKPMRKKEVFHLMRNTLEKITQKKSQLTKRIDWMEVIDLRIQDLTTALYFTILMELSGANCF